MPSENVIETDVLVIGGGMAGSFTAIKAKEQGLDVTLIDKGYVGKTSGIQLFQGDIEVFDPESGHNLDAWMDQINRGGEYLNNREWSEIVLRESYERYKDLVSWGVEFYQEGGKIEVYRTGVIEGFIMVHRKFLPALRKKALESGVKILDRIMASELLKQDGKVVGAIGFHTTSGDLYIFQAKATVVATGSSSLKLGSMPTGYWSADGEAIAYRAGAEITGKEFTVEGLMPLRDELNQKLREQTGKVPGADWKEIDFWARIPCFRGVLTGPIKPDINAVGGPVISPAWEAHCGQIPVYAGLDTLAPEQMEYIRHIYQRSGLGQPDEDVLKDGKLKFPVGLVGLTQIFGGAGIWPVKKECATSVPGLYAAGCSCATRAAGVAYPGRGFGLCHCAVTGTHAGLGAAEYAMKSKKITMDEAELAMFRKIACAPVERKGGFSPGWITQLVQSITLPYFVFQVKRAERLQAVLTLIEFVNSHLVPKLMAKDAHEWRMAQETKNMALDTEIRLRASLFRTESRGTHFREDYPRRDDPNWLAWVKLKEVQGKMKASKEPIPKDWWPNFSEPYEERYPRMFPGE